MNYLMKGLSKSPALRAGDMRAFYDQLRETPVPDGTWLVLNDLDGQVLNMLRPFGTANLPKLSDYPNKTEALARIRDRGWTVSGRMQAQVGSVQFVGVSLRVNGADGTMTHFLTTVLSEKRLQNVLGDQSVPPGWFKGVLDRKYVAIVAARDGPLPAAQTVRGPLGQIHTNGDERKTEAACAAPRCRYRCSEKMAQTRGRTEASLLGDAGRAARHGSNCRRNPAVVYAVAHTRAATYRSA